MLKLVRIAFKKACAGDMLAIKYITEYGMGKPGIGAAGKLADDAVGDEMERRMFGALSQQEQLQYIALQEKMRRAALDSPAGGGPAGEGARAD